MEYILFLFVSIPLLGFIVNVFVHSRNEKLLSQVAFSAMGLQFLAAFIFSIFWIAQGSPTLSTADIILYESDFYKFFLNFTYDKATATYIMVGAMLAFLITTYSTTYLHREKGYKRFFNTITFFYLGYNLIALSGNLVMLFIGWEVSGTASFLLIAFYRNRYIPVRNAVKIFSVYRIGDIALILAMWAEHHLWHHNITFYEMQDAANNHNIISHHSYLPFAFSFLLLVAASIKSAQFPFSSWLPRAMEGPTTSSAIFYGSLSVHIGVLLLMRSYPFWQALPAICYLVMGAGAVTYFIAAQIARVQPSIKGQIAYSSISQIGLMFIEVAWGFHALALVHFAGNAFLRSYQLLLSPSVVTYLIREQFYSFQPALPQKQSGKGFFQRLKNSIYILNVREWYLDDFMHHTLWNFFKRVGRLFHFISTKVAVFSVLFFAVATITVSFFHAELPSAFFWYFSLFLATVGLIYALWAFTEKQNIYWSWLMVGFTHFFNIMAVELIEDVSNTHLAIYLSGVFLSLALGLLALFRLQLHEGNVHLSGYQGHCYEHPHLETLFLLASLGMIGFPITTTFLGIELLFAYIHTHQLALLLLVAAGLLVCGLSVSRMYSRIFLGPHIKTYHEVARRSS